jgi:hypothetical protein
MPAITLRRLHHQRKPGLACDSAETGQSLLANPTDAACYALAFSVFAVR